MNTAAIELVLSNEYLKNAVVGLSQIDGCNFQIITKDLSMPDPHQKHGMYQLNPETYVTLAINITAVVSSILALAASIISLAKEIKSIKNNNASPLIEVKINNIIINIHNYSTSEELAEELSKEILRLGGSSSPRR